jgi:hypothetical protein
MKQSTTSSSSAGIAVDSEESKAIDDVAVIEERNVVNDVVAVIETPAEDITLDLDSEELHYLCQETNRPTLGVDWDYLGWVYHSSYSYSSTLPYFIHRNEALPCVRACSSGIFLRDTVMRQRVFDTARWKYTRHLMTECSWKYTCECYSYSKVTAMIPTELLYSNTSSNHRPCMCWSPLSSSLGQSYSLNDTYYTLYKSNHRA